MKADREGGRPIDLYVPKLDINGFTVEHQNSGQSKFVPPCVFYTSFFGPIDNNNGAASSGISYGFLQIPGDKVVHLCWMICLARADSIIISSYVEIFSDHMHVIPTCTDMTMLP